MSTLISEHNLSFSPSLASTIGLEEAILLQVLHDTCSYQSAQQHWYSLNQQQLQSLLPFWEWQQLQRIANSLKDKGIIALQAGPTAQLTFSMDQVQAESNRPEELNNSPNRAAVDLHQPGAKLLASDWQPDEDLLQLLALNHNIPRDFALAQCEDFLLYWRDRQQVSYSWPSKFRQHVLKEWRHHQTRQAKQQAVEASTRSLSQTWQPSPEALEILLRDEVSRDFIEDAIPEFVLYWTERGESHSTWNSKFIYHIRRQWAKYTHALEVDYEPRPIAANWQPSEDVFDIVRLANIDREFARQQVPEFVLFWRDTGQIQRSWNTKFLQHVKYQWASRHHLQEQAHAAQSGHSQSAQANTALKDSPFKQLTDRSWAEGLVDGV